MPEIASRRHLELVSPVIREALGRAGASLDDGRHGRGHRGPRADRRAARRRRGGEGARLGARAAARAGRTTCTATSPRSTCSRSTLEPPFTCLLASGGHTLLLDVADRAWDGVQRARDDARRRGGRGVRQGRPPARAAVPGRGRDRPARARGRPGGVPLPGRAGARARLLVLGAEDRAPLRGARPRSSRARARGAPTSRRATSGRSSAPSSSGSRRPAPTRLAIVGGVAANSELRAALPGRRRGAACALHRQRGDDRLGGPLHRGRRRRRTTLRSMRSRRRPELAARRPRGDRRRGLARRSAPRAQRTSVLRDAPPATWRGLVGDARPAVSLGQRMIVVLRTPSVAQRLARAKLATEQDERRWAAQAHAAQQQVLTQLARHGLGVAARLQLRPRARRLLGAARPARRSRCSSTTRRSPASIPCVRRFRPRSRVPRSRDGAPARRRRRRAAGLRRERRLDRAARHRRRPRRSRTSAAASSPGIDIVGGDDTADAQPNPQNPLAASSGTGPSSPACSSARAAPAASTAPRPERRCCRSGSPAGSPTASGRRRRLRAQRPADRGSRPRRRPERRRRRARRRADRADRCQPSRSQRFADSPEAQAVAGALALDMLVVAPAGNDGAAGPLFGSIAGPGGAAGGAHRRGDRPAPRDRGGAGSSLRQRARRDVRPAAAAARRGRAAPAAHLAVGRPATSAAGRDASTAAGSGSSPGARRSFRRARPERGGGRGGEGGRRARCCSTAGSCRPARSGSPSDVGVPVVGVPARLGARGRSR